MEFEETKDNFLVSTDKSKLDISLTYKYLSEESYWCKGIPFDVFMRSVENSVCFGVYENDKQTMPFGRQVGFARVVTDKATFGYLGDIFILDSHRGKGLSKWLMECILKHPELQGFRRMLLLTRDAQGLYEQFGFKKFHAPERCMELWNPDVYKNKEK